MRCGGNTNVVSHSWHSDILLPTSCLVYDCSLKLCRPCLSGYLERVMCQYWLGKVLEWGRFPFRIGGSYGEPRRPTSQFLGIDPPAMGESVYGGGAMMAVIGTMSDQTGGV